MMKKALLVASVGTTIPEADQNCIRPIEIALEKAFAEHRVFRAFTSRIICRRLSEQGVGIDSPEAAITRMTSEGYDDITVLPTHLLPGTEYDRLCAACSGHRILRPLLWDENSLDWMVNLITDIYSNEQKPILLAGHGSDSIANSIYSRLSSKLPENIFLACLKGECSLDSLFPALDTLPGKEILLMPLMIVAGMHVRNDLFEGSDSWKEILEHRGLHVHTFSNGLGSLPSIQQRFIDQVSAAFSLSTGYMK